MTKIEEIRQEITAMYPELDKEEVNALAYDEYKRRISRQWRAVPEHHERRKQQAKERRQKLKVARESALAKIASLRRDKDEQSK